jgi:hypothetical protein
VCTCVIPPLSVADSLPPLSGPPLAPGTDDSAGDRHLSADSVFVKGANSRANPSNHRGRAEERGTRAENGGRLGGAVRVCSSTRMLSFKGEREVLLTIKKTIPPLSVWPCGTPFRKWAQNSIGPSQSPSRWRRRAPWDVPPLLGGGFGFRNRSPDSLVRRKGRYHPFPMSAGSPWRARDVARRVPQLGGTLSEHGPGIIVVMS